MTVTQRLAVTKQRHIKDPGYNVDWTLMGISSGPKKGVVVAVKISNLNDVAIPKDAMPTPTLEITDYHGDLKKFEPLTEAESGVYPGTDAAIGAHADVVLRYGFNTGIGTLYNNAAFTIGNVTWKGNIVR